MESSRAAAPDAHAHAAALPALARRFRGGVTRARGRRRSRRRKRRGVGQAPACVSVRVRGSAFAEESPTAREGTLGQTDARIARACPWRGQGRGILGGTLTQHSEATQEERKTGAHTCEPLQQSGWQRWPRRAAVAPGAFPRRACESGGASKKSSGPRFPAQTVSGGCCERRDEAKRHREGAGPRRGGLRARP